MDCQGQEFFISFIVNKDCQWSSFQNRTLPTEDSFRLSCRISMEIAANSVEFNFHFKYLNSSKYKKNSIEIQRKLRWKWQKTGMTSPWIVCFSIDRPVSSYSKMHHYMKGYLLRDRLFPQFFFRVLSSLFNCVHIYRIKIAFLNVKNFSSSCLQLSFVFQLDHLQHLSFFEQSCYRRLLPITKNISWDKTEGDKAHTRCYKLEHFPHSCSLHDE